MPATTPIALVDEGLGNSSYLIEIGDRRALVLDPEREPSAYLAAAEARGLTVAFAVETHLHADFVPGSRELAAQGAEVLAPAAGPRRDHCRRVRSRGADLGRGSAHRNVRFRRRPSHVRNASSKASGRAPARAVAVGTSS